MTAPQTEVRPVARRLPVAPLTGLAAGLAAVHAALLLVLHGRGAPVPFTTSRGEEVLLTGSGVDAHDTVFTAAGNLGVAVVTLVVAALVPLALRSALAGSTRAVLLLLGLLGYLFYASATTAFGSAYGPLFLLEVAVLAAALPAFVLAAAAVSRSARVATVDGRGYPRRPLGIFLLAAAAVTAVVWATPLVGSLVTGTAPPTLGPATTMVTDVLDLAVIVPATLVGGLLVLRRSPLGPVVAAPLLALITALLPAIVLSTLFQVGAGIRFGPAEVAGPIGGFLLLGLVGAVLLSRLLAAAPATR
ncbi:hypothetical protein [Pseudonocardia xishanensis]|uniref:Uncharacterized protein n=1 Tax=Pseudonocardia xishanensis TaxID=630995 RepID=A0ABP8RMC6_9PSEU